MKAWSKLHFFWWGNIRHEMSYVKERLGLWFLKDPKTDIQAKEYAPWLDAYEAGELEHWKRTPRGYLTALLLVDQFPRNNFRDSARSYAYDDKALALSLYAINRGLDDELDPLENVFLYLPVEHSEDPAMQRLSVELFARLHEKAPAGIRDFTKITLDYAIRHQVVIDRFGRYPHRNEALGRASTPAELEFLKLPESRF